jgi:acyl carrier protein
VPDAHYEADVREALATEGGLGDAAREIDREADLFEAGLTSLGAVAVVVGLEERFRFRFDLESLFLDALASVAGICGLIEAGVTARTGD